MGGNKYNQKKTKQMKKQQDFRTIQPKVINLDIHFSEHTTSLDNKPHHKVIGMRYRRL